MMSRLHSTRQRRFVCFAASVVLASACVAQTEVPNHVRYMVLAVIESGGRAEFHEDHGASTQRPEWSCEPSHSDCGQGPGDMPRPDEGRLTDAAAPIDAGHDSRSEARAERVLPMCRRSADFRPRRPLLPVA
jgi:hypothetical protein